MEQLGDAFWRAIVPLLTTILIGYLVSLAKQYRDRITDERLRALIDEFVRAAEQLYGIDSGPAKFEYVVRRLEEHGVEPARAAIEAAVYDLNEAKEYY